MGNNNEEFNRNQASKDKRNIRSRSNEERHNRNAQESTIEQSIPRINTDNL